MIAFVPGHCIKGAIPKRNAAEQPIYIQFKPRSIATYKSIDKLARSQSSLQNPANSSEEDKTIPRHARE